MHGMPIFFMLPAIFISLAFFVILGIVIGRLYKTKKKTEERLSKVKNIEYTEILSSGGGTASSFDDGYNRYGTEPTTKFLVVYFDGTREIVSVRDGSELCAEYLKCLKQ